MQPETQVGISSLSLHSESSTVPATLGGPRGTSDLMASSQVSEPSRGPRCAAPPHSAGPLDPYSRPCLACMTLLCAPAASACPLGPRSSRASGALGCSSLELCTALLTLQGLSRKNTCRHPHAPPLACAYETPPHTFSHLFLKVTLPSLLTSPHEGLEDRGTHPAPGWREAPVHRVPIQGCVC